jgi:Zn-dependent oligopeptidase
MAYVKGANVRKKVWAACESRMSANAGVMEELVAIRQKIAALLGYEHWAAYQVEICMAQDVDAVRAFLKSLLERLLPLAKRETLALLELRTTLRQADGLDVDPRTWADVCIARIH